jgi:hypothetical protein
VVNSNPQITTVSPSSIPPGTLNQVLTLQGSGFINGAIVTISCDTAQIPGCTNGINIIKINSVTFNEINLTVDVLSAATVGQRTLLVDNLDGGKNSFSDKFSIGNVASTTVTALGVYGEGTITNPRYRSWNGLGWSEEKSATAVTDPIKWNILRSNPVRDEKILATLDEKNRLNVQVWDGTQWGNFMEIASSSGAASMEGRAFDVAYENGGRGLVVYALSGSSDLKYRIWDGTSWGTDEKQVLNTVTSGVQ